MPTSEDFAAEQWDSALVQPFLTCPSDLVDACNIWVVPAAPHWWQDDLCIDHDNADDSTEVASLRWHIYSAAVQLASLGPMLHFQPPPRDAQPPGCLRRCAFSA